MTSQPDPITPSAANLKSYMRATGWHEGGQLTFGSIWAKDGTEFAVPHEDHDRAWLRDVVGRLSAAEGRGADETAAAVLAHRDGAVSLDDGECDRLRALMAGRGAETTLGEHRPGPRRMAARHLVAPECRSCGQRWPCEGSWQARAERAEAKLAEVQERAEYWAPLEPGPFAAAGKALLAILGDGQEHADEKGPTP